MNVAIRWLILYHYALPWRTFERDGWPEHGYAPLRGKR